MAPPKVTTPLDLSADTVALRERLESNADFLDRRMDGNYKIGRRILRKFGRDQRQAAAALAESQAECVTLRNRLTKRGLGMTMAPAINQEPTASDSLASVPAPAPSFHYMPDVGDGPCFRCGENNPVVWFANPSKHWNYVVGGPDATDDPGGLLCPNCFFFLAHASGLDKVWAFIPEDETALAWEERFDNGRKVGREEALAEGGAKAEGHSQGSA